MVLQAKLFDRILVKAGIATEEKILTADRKKVKKVIIHKVDELGRKLTTHNLRHTFATKLAQATSAISSCSRPRSVTPRSAPPTATAM